MPKQKPTPDSDAVIPQSRRVPPRHAAAKTAAARQPSSQPQVSTEAVKPSNLATRVGTGLAAFEGIIAPTRA